VIRTALIVIEILIGVAALAGEAGVLYRGLKAAPEQPREA
jgi:hypothetical protein